MRENLNKVLSLSYIEKGTGKHQSNSVFSIEGLSPCIMAGLGTKMPGLFIIVEDKNEYKGKQG